MATAREARQVGDGDVLYLGGRLEHGDDEPHQGRDGHHGQRHRDRQKQRFLGLCAVGGDIPRFAGAVGEIGSVGRFVSAPGRVRRRSLGGALVGRAFDVSG